MLTTRATLQGAGFRVVSEAGLARSVVAVPRFGTLLVASTPSAAVLGLQIPPGALAPVGRAVGR